MENQYCVVLCTCKNLIKGKELSHSLVSNKLAACVNLVPGLTSIYEWQGKIQEEQECLLVIKTRSDLFEALRLRIVELHQYDVPEVIQLNINNGHHPYLEWIKACTNA